MDSAKHRYQQERIAHWNKISRLHENPKRIGAFYQKLLQHYYKFLIPPGLRILELGCGHGDLLALLEPSVGVGADFSDEMIRYASARHPGLSFVRADAHDMVFKEKFDVIILSDLVNDLRDVQSVFERFREISHPGTRIILNFYNNLWRIPLSVANRLGMGAAVLEQNWLSPHDIFNLLNLEDFDVVKHIRCILFPLKVPLLPNLANQYMVNFLPFSWFALTNFVVARPAPMRKQARTGGQPSVSVIIPARNEAGNIEHILKRTPSLGSETELIFVEGHSNDNTFETIEQVIERFPEKKCRLFRQPGKGKGDAVRLGFEKARGDVLMILDADMTVPPEDLTRFLMRLYREKGNLSTGFALSIRWNRNPCVSLTSSETSFSAWHFHGCSGSQ